MKKNLIIIYFIASLFLCSCKDNIIGEAVYYPQFLWSDSSNSVINKTMHFDWNKDAKDEPNTKISLQFCDNNGNAIPQSIMTVFVNGKPTENNIIRNITSTTDSIDFTVEFSPNADDGKYQGFLKIIDYTSLKRIEDTDLSQNPHPMLDQYTFKFTKVMNPLAKLLMWIGIIIGSILIFWLFILKRILFPQFPKFRKTMLIRKNGQIISQSNIILTGARQVIISDKKGKQGVLNRIFCGKIVYVQNELFTDPLKFVPRKKNAMVLGLGYQVSPNPIPRNGISTINNPNLKIQITLQ